MRAEFVIETKYGKFDLTPTEKDHIHVHSSEDRYGYPKINKVPYHVSCHLYRWGDNKFYIGRQGTDEWKRGQSLYMTRPKRDYKKSFPSESAKKKMLEELERVVNLWADAEPLHMVMAERLYISDAIKSRKAALKELKEAVIEVEKEIKLLEKGRHLDSSCRFNLGTSRPSMFKTVKRR